MRQLTLEEAVELLEPGMTVFLHGTASEPRAFVEALLARPDALREVHLITSFIPGINTVDLAGLGPGQRYTSFMASRPPARPRGPREALRLPYSALPDYLAGLPRLDLAIVQGRCMADGSMSTGISGELIPSACARADRVCLLDNAHMPLPAAGCELASPDFLVPVDSSLVTYDAGDRVDAVSETIADAVAALIPDGATLQSGLGVVPAAVFARLARRRGLRLFSGMISDSVMALAESGALDPDAQHVYGMAMGSLGLYDWLAARPGLRVADCRVTHDRDRLAAIPAFHAINSALEVGLDGSVNAERLGPHTVSGPGGLPDYAFGGRHSDGGASIIALPASNRKREVSRIVARVANHDAPTLAPGTITHVVTEFGVADLCSDDPDERARRLVAVAAPAHREALRAATR